ncbi:MAG: hemerythrin family protein [Gammaproteobacteria bacterium]|nr:hemerythrin family protein [Gammaproteobacteria bacterium]
MISLNQNLLLGVPLLDSEHQELADVINTIAAEASNHSMTQEMPSPACCRRVGNLLQDLSQLSAQHFATEERMMEESCYPNLLEHRQEHRLMMAELKALIRALCSGRECLTSRDLTSLKGWFIGHLATDDKPFAQYLLAQGLHQGFWPMRPALAI